MTSPVILVAGTWGRSYPWWDPTAPLAMYLRESGIPVLGYDDQDPYTWTTDVDGVGFDKDTVDWDEAGKALVWYAHLKHPPNGSGEPRRVSVLAHSHGGQVVAKAARHGLLLDRVVTVATPVRKHLEHEYDELRSHCRFWTHLYTNEPFWDGWQRRGQFEWSWIGLKRLFVPVREMPAAHMNVHEPHQTHVGLIDAMLWRERQWHRLFL